MSNARLHETLSRGRGITLQARDEELESDNFLAELCMALLNSLFSFKTD
jgi:hypothetical protein